MSNKAYLSRWKEEYISKRDSLTEQTCTKCSKTLPIEQFAKRKLRSGIYGYEKQCKECRGHHVKVWAKKNINTIKAYSIKDRKPKIKKVCPVCNKQFETSRKNQIKCNSKCSNVRVLIPLVVRHCPQCKQQYQVKETSSKKYCCKQCADLAVTNPIKYRKRREANDLTFRLTNQIRKKIYLTLRGKQKYVHSLELLGCSSEYARRHLERQFTKGMSWGNWSMHGWHIDHIIPIASFDLTDIEQQKRCFHYTNIQPLWAKDNYKKRDKIIEKQLILL
jgi:hypothetical protein